MTKSIEKTCQTCGKIFLAQPSRIKVSGGKYCSRKCIPSRQIRKNALARVNSNKLYKEKYPEKIKAGKILRNEIRYGRMFRQPCEICGNQKTEAHHDDYSRPLKVRWLCRIHHNEIHGNANRGGGHKSQNA